MANSEDARKKETAGIVGWTTLAVMVAVAIGNRFITPFIMTAPVLIFVLRSDDSRSTTMMRELAWRWMATTLVAVLIATAFVPGRAASSFLFGPELSASVPRFLAGVGSAPWSVLWLLGMSLLFVLGTVLSGGIAGWILAGTFVCAAAISGSAVFGFSHNILQSAFIALSPWQWVFLAGLWFLLDPLSRFSQARVLRRGATFDFSRHKRPIVWGGGLILLSIILRIALVAPYASLARKLTIM